MTLGQKIKKLRTDKGLTQKELADKIYVTFQTVSKWEKDENEPDVSTLRELAKLFDCSLDYLLSEDEVAAPTKEETPVVVTPVQKVIIQKELHVCERCNKDIPEDELVVSRTCVRHAGRGHSAEYRQAYYHKSCLEEVEREAAIKSKEIAERKRHRAKKLSFGWSIFGSIVALGLSLGLMFGLGASIHPALVVLFSVLIAYGIFAAIYCILAGSYIAEVFEAVAGFSIKMPGIIFAWDLDGIAWLIAMKILFAILGIMLSAFVIGFAVALSAFLSILSFPFVLAHNNSTGYKDSLVY